MFLPVDPHGACAGFGGNGCPCNTQRRVIYLVIFVIFFVANNKKQSKTVAIPDGRRGKHLAIGPYTEHND